MSTIFDIGKDFRMLAKEKIDRELKEFKGDKYGEAVHTYVANAIREFCDKNERFAEVVYKTKRSLSDCISEIMKGCGKHISDIEVYRRAAKLYFPNSEVEFVMNIVLTGDEPDETYMDKVSPKPKAKQQTANPTKAKPPKKPEKKKTDIIQMSLF